MKGINSKIIAFVLAISPILDPYIILSIGSSELRVMDVLAVMCAIYVLVKERAIRVNKPLLFITTSILFLNLFTFLSSDSTRNFVLTIKVIIVWFLYFFLNSLMWQSLNKHKFIKYARVIGIFASLVLVVQFVLYNLGYVNFWNGQMPLLNLSKYDDWSNMIDIIGVVRVHSIFQEPSYVAIYLLPLIAYSLKMNNFKELILYILAALLSTSSIAFMGILVIILYMVSSTSFLVINLKKTRRFFSFLLFVIITFFLLYLFSDAVKEIVEYSIEKITGFRSDLQSSRMGSTRIRLLGNIDIFQDYTGWFKIFGVGVHQYPIMYPYLIPYSSTVVTFILNYGIIGFIALMYFFISIMRSLDKKSKIFGIIFIMYCFIDLFWFHWYFFYALTWIEVYRNNNIIKCEVEKV